MTTKTKPTPFNPAAAAKGLAAKLREAKPGEKVLDLELELIEADPDQPRRTFNKTTLQELAASMKIRQEQPIVVREIKGAKASYRIVFGERRYRAAEIAELPTIKAIVRVYTPDELKEILTSQLVENTQREGMDAVDTINAYARLVDLHGFDGAIERSGKSRSYLSKISTITKSGELVKQVLATRVTEDIETVYLLARLAKADEGSAGRVVASWSDAGYAGNQRTDVQRALDRIALREADATPKQSPAVRSAPPAATGKAAGGAPTTSSSAAPLKTSTDTGAPQVRSGSSVIRAPGQAGAGAGGRTDLTESQTGSSRGDSPVSGENGAGGEAAHAEGVLLCEFVRLHPKTIAVCTDSKVFEFDRAMLLAALRAAGIREV